MLFIGHIAASYILAQSPRLFGYEPSSMDLFKIIVFGNVLDLDLLVGFVTGKRGDQHHDLITHTPLFAIVAWVVFSYFFDFNILILASLLLHLILDDIGYWFCKLGLQEVSSYPQINWGYPFTTFTSKEKRVAGNKMIISNYLKKAKANVVLEIVLLISAILIMVII